MQPGRRKCGAPRQTPHLTECQTSLHASAAAASDQAQTSKSGAEQDERGGFRDCVHIRNGGGGDVGIVKVKGVPSETNVAPIGTARLPPGSRSETKLPLRVAVPPAPPPV